jgi:hypothetical protein
MHSIIRWWLVEWREYWDIIPRKCRPSGTVILFFADPGFAHPSGVTLQPGLKYAIPPGLRTLFPRESTPFSMVVKITKNQPPDDHEESAIWRFFFDRELRDHEEPAIWRFRLIADPAIKKISH